MGLNEPVVSKTQLKSSKSIHSIDIIVDFYLFDFVSYPRFRQFSRIIFTSVFSLECITIQIKTKCLILFTPVVFKHRGPSMTIHYQSNESLMYGLFFSFLRKRLVEVMIDRQCNDIYLEKNPPKNTGEDVT